MTTDDREPDHTDPGRGRDIGSSGYPEEQPGGADPGESRSRSGGGKDKPDTSGNQDSDPAGATGNPGAAGAED